MSHEVITSSIGKIKDSVVHSIFSWLVITIQSADKDIRPVGALQIAQQASKIYDRLWMMFLCWADMGKVLVLCRHPHKIIQKSNSKYESFQGTLSTLPIKNFHCRESLKGLLGSSFFPLLCTDYLRYLWWYLRYIWCQHMISAYLYQHGAYILLWLNWMCNYEINCCSVAKLCLILCDPMDCSMLGSTVLHCLSEFVQIHKLSCEYLVVNTKIVGDTI